MIENTNNTFTGSGALRALLNPNDNVPTPLVELPDTLNTFHTDSVRIFAKAAFLSPLFNIKQLPALNLLQDAKDTGKLNGVTALVENSSGNMVLSLAVLARQFGISRVVAVVPRDIPPGKLELLRFVGADIEFISTAAGAKSGIERAKELGAQDGWHNLGQYENKANPAAYGKYLAPQLLQQTNNAMTIFCAGLGTTGTIAGGAEYFKQHSLNISIVGVIPHDAVPGVRSEQRLKEVKFSWQGILDHQMTVTTRDAFKRSLELYRAGLFAGPSSGMALAGLLQMLSIEKDAGRLDQYRNTDGEVVAVFVCPDSALLYLDKYSTQLEPEDF